MTILALIVCAVDAKLKFFSFPLCGYSSPVSMNVAGISANPPVKTSGERRTKKTGFENVMAENVRDILVQMCLEGSGYNGEVGREGSRREVRSRLFIRGERTSAGEGGNEKKGGERERGLLKKK